MTTPRSSRRHGVLLVEMLVTIGLIGIFIVVAGRLFSTTLKLTHASHTAAGGVVTFESCVRALRRDVWGAAETIALPEGGVRIAQGDGAVISWTPDKDGALVRHSDEANRQSVRRWPGLVEKMTLHPDVGGLVVRAGDDQVRLVSQLLLARAGTP